MGRGDVGNWEKRMSGLGRWWEGVRRWDGDGEWEG